MARVSRKTRPENPVENLDESPDENPEGATLFREFRDDDYVRLQRRDDLEKTMVYHGRLAPGEATSDKVAELFGGGFYRAQHFQRDERGSYVITGTRTFKVPGEYKPPRELPGTSKTAPPTTSAPGNGAVKPEVGSFSGGSATEALNSALVGSVIELLKSMREPQRQVAPTPNIDWGAVIGGVVSLVTVMVESKRDTPQLDPLVLLKEIKEIVAPAGAQQPASNAIADAVKGLRELMHLKDSVDGKEPPMDAEGMMYAAVPKLIDAIAQNKSPATPPAQGQPAVAQIPANPNLTLWQKLLLSQKTNLLRGAQMGLEPEFAAEMALRFTPQHAQGILNEFLALPDHVELAMQTIPELRQFPQWTTAFFGEVVTQLSGNDEEEEVIEDGSASTEGSDASD